MIVFGVSKKELKVFLEQSLRTNEKELFLILHELQGLTFSTAVRKIIDRNYPESTVKSILQRLKKYNLIDFGDSENKGKSLMFTNLGNRFFEILRGESE